MRKYITFLKHFVIREREEDVIPDRAKRRVGGSVCKERCKYGRWDA